MNGVALKFFALLLLFSCSIYAQGPAPETAPPLFPKGALISYGSDFFSRDLPRGGGPITPTSQPTFSHHGTFVFTWGFYPDFDLTAQLPLVTNRFEGDREASVTGVGDLLVLLKYRFYRRDSERGTTQASFTAGPEFSTGNTKKSDTNGVRLPASLQPGSGSTDFFFSVNWTYTGLFNLRRLVADADFHSLLRTRGTQNTRLGNDLVSRFWLSYRPYESKDVRREWFIGPSFTWLHSSNDEIAGVTQQESGGDSLLAGITTYFGISPGVHIWFTLERSVAHSNGQYFSPARKHVSFGITRQFRFL